MRGLLYTLLGVAMFAALLPACCDKVDPFSNRGSRPRVERERYARPASLGENTEAPKHVLFRKAATEAGPFSPFTQEPIASVIKERILEDAQTTLWPGSEVASYEVVFTPQVIVLVETEINRASGGSFGRIAMAQDGTVRLAGWDLDGTHVVFMVSLAAPEGGTVVVLVELNRDLDVEQRARRSKEEQG